MDERKIIERIARRNGKHAYLWVRLGDYGEYDVCDNLHDAAKQCATVGIIDVERWRKSGFEAIGFSGHNYVSLFWGDDPDQPEFLDDLSASERMRFVKHLRAITED